MKHYITIDIGGTSIKYGLIDDTEQLIEDQEMPTEAYKGGPSILEKVAGIVAYYQTKVEVAGICLSSAGNTGRTRLLNMKGRWSFFYVIGNYFVMFQ